MVRLATNLDQIHEAGAELIAVSVDDAARQAGMTQRWGLDTVCFVADPGGEDFLQPLNLFDPDERGGIALPGMILVAPDGTEAYRYVGRDYADRTNDVEIWPALEVLNLGPVDPTPCIPDVDVPGDLTGFFRPAEYRTFFFGNQVGSMAIARRLGPDSEAGQVAIEHVSMSKDSLRAWKEWRNHTR